MRKLALTT